jgi:hypothetical protein
MYIFFLCIKKYIHTHTHILLLLLLQLQASAEIAPKMMARHATMETMFLTTDARTLAL